MRGPPVVLTNTLGRPVTNIISERGAVPMTVVNTLGEPVTLVAQGGEPVTLFNPNGTLWDYPFSLFANNEQGAWYDPSDFSTLYQNSTGWSDNSSNFCAEISGKMRLPLLIHLAMKITCSILLLVGVMAIYTKHCLRLLSQHHLTRPRKGQDGNLCFEICYTNQRAGCDHAYFNLFICNSEPFKQASKIVIEMLTKERNILAVIKRLARWV